MPHVGVIVRWVAIMKGTLMVSAIDDLERIGAFEMNIFESVSVLFDEGLPLAC